MITLTVKGMHCKSCVMLITDALEERGVSNIKIDLDEKKQIGKLTCEFNADKKELVKIIEKEGYKVE